MKESNPYDAPTVDGIRGSCTSDSCVEFDFVVEDVKWFCVRENSKQNFGGRNGQITLSACAVILAFIGLLAGVSQINVFTITIPALLVACSFAYIAIRYRSIMTRRLEVQLDKMLTARSSLGTYGRCTARIDEQGVYLERPAGHSFWKWWAVPEIVSDDGYLMIYRSAVEATLVPQRAFATNDHFRAFAENAKRLWEEYKEIPVAETA